MSYVYCSADRNRFRHMSNVPDTKHPRYRVTYPAVRDNACSVSMLGLKSCEQRRLLGIALSAVVALVVFGCVVNVQGDAHLHMQCSQGALRFE